MNETRTNQPATGAENVTWNLSDLVQEPADAGIDSALATAGERLDAFAQRYKGRIAAINAPSMVELLTEYESIVELVGRAESYASLSWCTASSDPVRGALLQKVMERQSLLAQKWIFFDIEWANAPDVHAQSLINDPLLARWRHWLLTARRYRPHLLSEPEEKILAEKAITSRHAWSRFFDETMAASSYEWKGARVPLQVILQNLHAAERDVRKDAAASVTRGLRAIQKSTTYIFNTLLTEKFSEDRLRSFPTWISARNMDNQVEDATVEALVSAVTSRYDIVARFYGLKKRLLGLPELFDYDRYALLPAAERRFTWAEAREIVLAAYRGFHPRMAEIADLFFKNKWIDAAVNPAKRQGAFSSSTVPSVHPYILMSFQGNASDVMTLAHELGHGVHQYLARERGVLQQSTPLTMAETASVFGETLVFHSLLAREKDPSVVLSLLTQQIESSFATVFRQVAMNRFEARAHATRREEGEMSTETLSRLWLETQREMFGGSLTLTEDYGLWWSYIPHFVHTPGYVYAYAFGDLLVRALYKRSRSAGPDFPELYIHMLAAGGSDWPNALVKPLGVDLADPAFWAQGVLLLEEMVTQAESLAAGRDHLTDE